MISKINQQLIDHYDALASRRDAFRAQNFYYYKLLHKEYRFFIPKGKKVLEVGCGTGELLNALEPSFGVGVDISPKMIEIARGKFPTMKFYAGEVGGLPIEEKFDYVVLSGLLGELADIQDTLAAIHKFCLPRTRIVIEYYSYFWQYFLRLGETLGWKIPQRIQNWVTIGDVRNFLALTGYEAVKIERQILLPINIPLISWLMNKIIARLPVFNALCLNHFVIARPIFELDREFSVSILVPCRNEKGNMEAAINRTPEFGASQEFIFVEGHSQDGTYEEIERLIKAYPNKKIRLFKQPGKGKADAVHFGFSKATGEVLMILDADLTVAPEDLLKFYNAIRSGRGEFINGCRLVYPMEREAMRFLNLVANKLFGVLFSWLLGQRFKDTLCGTKVMFRWDYEEIVAGRTYFGDFDPFGDFDLIFGAMKLNRKVLELPIRYKVRQYGTTQIQRFRHGFLLLRMCLFAMRKIKFH